MPHVKKWVKAEKKQPKVLSEMKGVPNSCRWPIGQGFPATWGVRSSSGFKSLGRCCKNGQTIIEEEIMSANEGIDRQKFMEQLEEISSIEELFAVYDNESADFNDGEDYIDFTVDSGAADTVADKCIAPECPVVPSAGSMKGVKYVAAAGKVISNEGEKNVTTQTAEGHVCGIKIQIAQVNKALLSVSKICDAGHEVIFTQAGGRIVHQETGQVMNFRRVDGVYRLRVKIVRQGQSGFARPGK
jgi:hypothetical protein